MMQFLLHVTCSCISNAYILYFSIYLLYLNCVGAFLIVSFSLPLFLFTLVVSMAPKRKSTPSRNLTFCSVMKIPVRISWRTFLNKAFILNAKSFWCTLPTLTFPLSITVGDGSHCVMSQSPVLSCLFRSFTPTCTRSIVQYHFSSLAFKVRIFLSHYSLLRMCFRFLG